jgi:hypothetical protein
VHVAGVQLREVRDELCRDVPLAADERLDLLDEGRVRNTSEG